MNFADRKIVHSLRVQKSKRNAKRGKKDSIKKGARKEVSRFNESTENYMMDGEIECGIKRRVKNKVILLPSTVGNIIRYAQSCFLLCERVTYVYFSADELFTPTNIIIYLNYAFPNLDIQDANEFALY